MSNEINTAIVEAEPSSMGNTNISVLDFASRRAKQLSQQPPQQEEMQETEIEPEVDEFEEDVPEIESEETESEEQEATNVLSKDLDDLSEEEFQALVDKSRSRALSRYGELTAKAKAAEEKLAAYEAQMNAKKQEVDPLQREGEVKDNPYKDIADIKGLQDKAEETSSVIEWAEDILFNSDGYAADDIVVEVEGKELTKADVRRSLLNARKSRDKYLPAQLKVIQAKQQGEQMKEAFQAQAVKELNWMQGEDNDVRRQYEAIMSDPRVEKLSTALDPDVAAQLPYLLAHAANSIYGQKAAPAKTSPKLNPPSNAFSNATRSEKAAPKSAKAINEMSKRFKETGNKNDFITLRTLQLSNRK